MSELPADIKTLFADTLEKPTPAERNAYLSIACRGDAALRQRVEALLQAYEEAHDVPDTPIVSLDVPSPEMLLTEGPGTIIGRYKLLEKIGEGGMAVVYMAEQTEPIRRKVALKIIKLGMDTRQVIARFEAERQALALMGHPSIAKVLDAGATETGRPYFVMELVTGVSITEYCDKNSLSTRDRLTLFLQVCNAVQHAHQKGIIHRDLKPSNVMVTHHDGKPVPKVIDFGIAKATSQRLTEKTLFTRYAHIIGTPAYMSPEQAELSDLDIDTRTDIYSLGVLLYELLTGTTPFSEEELRKAGYVEMQRVIREQEPMKPSTRIKTALRRASVPLAGQTSCGDARPTKKAGPRWPCDSMGGTPMLREVRGDLDWIVMKSLEKDRARRYETANGLAEDVRRHLEHEPIIARGPGTTYHLQKFVRRHRSETIAVLAAVVVAGAGIVILSMWNQDRLQLVEAEGFRHKNVLSQAREQYAKAERDAALETIKPILYSRHVGPEAQLLHAGILVDDRRSDEAVAVLRGLLDERPEIAGAAHSLLARILWEAGSPNAEKLQEIEEHRQKAEALLPETAEAYFLRAMTALTVKEQLASLDRALQLDPSHYEARRLRAFTYYASRKYDRLRDDALVMAVSRPRDSLGHSLRAIAFRELARYPEAIAEYDSALALTPKADPQYVDLSSQRCGTLLRMGDYERVVAEAQESLKLSPSKPVFQYYVFCALTALGEYEKASTLFRVIVGHTPASRSQFQDWSMKYVFDTLEAGRSWHPAGREPVGAAFLPMLEAEGTYHHLSAKARRMVADGFAANWLPDGSKLAYSLGVHGYSGVAVFDPATKETELLIVPGKDPRWSPDGRYIAFVRDCQILRLSEFTTAERRYQHRQLADEEVWIMKSNGTEPRRVARGGWPSWSQDSKRLYYHSRTDKVLFSIAIEGRDARPIPILPCSNDFPSTSADERYVAYVEGASLQVRDVVSQTLVAEWPVPFTTWGGACWSPTGSELCLGSDTTTQERTGLWIYAFGRPHPAQVLAGQIASASWSPKATSLAFCLGPPYYEVWGAGLGPSVSTVEALAPGQTPEKHYREMLRLCTRAIEADPQDPNAYSDRARYYGYLRDRANATADMRRWSVVIGGGMVSDVQSAVPGNFVGVINLPFDCQIVFSVERPVNEIPVMSLAFGQKGRWEMKLFEIPMLVASVFGFCLLSGPDSPPAYADFTFGLPTNLGPAVNGPLQEWPAWVSADGLSFLLGRRTNGSVPWEALVATRTTVQDPWQLGISLGVWGPDAALLFLRSAGLVPGVTTSEGLQAYLCWSDSEQPGGYGGYDLWMTKREKTDANWRPLVNLGPTVNSPNWDLNPSISPDGLDLYFASNRPGGSGSFDLWVAKRATLSDPWGPPENLGPSVNSSSAEYQPSISSDGLVLFFASGPASGSGPDDIWVTTRATKADKWGIRVNLGLTVNTAADDCYPITSADGSTLYFTSARPGGCGSYDIWQVPIIPIVDFNGDGKVDAADMAMLVDSWGQSNTLCDIGPFPWGDGVVDEKDLRVLMQSLVTPGPHASDVPCTVVLSWISPSFAKAYDVYFGTSFADVNSADRVDPHGVLVSKAQTATTYDSADLLQYSRTYYWRVDFVIPGPTPTIYQGPVLKFTTEAFSYPIKNVAAKASSSQTNMGPEKTVDGSGLDKSDGHSTNGADMWLSTGVQPNWIQFEFDKVYALHELWVWNSNQLVEPFIGFGARSVKIEYSTDGTTWTPLANVPEFARAPGKPDYVHNTTVSFGGVSAKYVKLTIEKGWGTTPSTGLSEVRFFYIPDRSTPKP